MSRLAIDFSKNYVQSADDCDHIGYQMADAHLLQRLQVDEGRRAYTNTPRLRRAIGNEVTTDLAFWSFDRMIIITHGQLDYLWQFCVDRTIGQFVQSLNDDATRLSHLFQTNEVAVVGVSVVSKGNVKIHIRISSVGPRLSDIPGDTRTAQRGTGYSNSNCLVAGNHANAN